MHNAEEITEETNAKVLFSSTKSNGNELLYGSFLDSFQNIYIKYQFISYRLGIYTVCTLFFPLINTYVYNAFELIDERSKVSIA